MCVASVAWFQGARVDDTRTSRGRYIARSDETRILNDDVMQQPFIYYTHSQDVRQRQRPDNSMTDHFNQQSVGNVVISF